MNKLNRRKFLYTTGNFLLGLFGTGCLTDNRLSQAKPAGKQKQKLNFVFILIDDLGWTDGSGFGSDFYETPNIDRLAKQSMTFTNGYMASPLCSPSRASILIGKYPARFNFTHVPWAFYRKEQPIRTRKLLEPLIARNIPLEQTTIAEALKPAGYISASIGKWHLGDTGKAGFGPDKQGFDYVSLRYNKKAPGDGKGVDFFTQKAEDFLDKNKDKPFFLYLAHHAVHHPFFVTEQLAQKYHKKKPGKRHYHPLYAASIEHVDNSVGRILKKLDDLNLSDNTLVIFTSDNGGLKGKMDNLPWQITDNTPLRGGKNMLYEGGIRIPWLIRWPGVVKPKSKCDVPVSSVDFFPTLIELADAPRNTYDFTDGVSITPLLKQKGSIKPRALYWHHPHYCGSLFPPAAAIRKGDYKLIKFFEDNSLHLYNLKDDISEKNNLADKEPKKAAQLEKMLDQWLKDVNANLPKPNPDYPKHHPRKKE